MCGGGGNKNCYYYYLSDDTAQSIDFYQLNLVFDVVIACVTTTLYSYAITLV